MKKRTGLIILIVLMQIVLVGYTTHTVKLPEGIKLMELDGLNLCPDAPDDDEPSVPNPTPQLTPKPTPTMIPTPKPTAEVKYEVGIKIEGTSIKRAGANISMEDLLKLAQNEQVFRVNVYCKYGDYTIVKNTMEILGDKFNEVESDEKEIK